VRKDDPANQNTRPQQLYEPSDVNVRIAPGPPQPKGSVVPTPPASVWSPGSLSVTLPSQCDGSGLLSVAGPPQPRYVPSESTTSIELDSLKSRIAELESQLSKGSNLNTSILPFAASSPRPDHSVHINSGLAGPIHVLQENSAFGHAIVRGISHKNRVFGQSHWMTGFVAFRDVIEMLEPQFRNGNSPLPASIHRAKCLARVIKSQRSPLWPSIPTNDLPPKDVCDTLIEHYLRTFETLYRILHVPTFRKEYEALWSSSSEPAIAFMMQLKLVLAIGAIFYDENCSMRADATGWIYEAQTWLSSPTFKSRLGIQHLQTNILLLLARELVDVGSELVWISAGALFREAVYTGLHKDPSRLPKTTLFESEMRRRVWNTILEINLQFSLIAGGPCLVSLEDFDTQPPGNFDDEQLTVPDTQAHPRQVFTQSSLAIALRKTLSTRLIVVKFLNDVASNGTYQETLRIDTGLRASYKELRIALQTYETDAAMPAASTFALGAIEFIMQRYISSLHIPYLNPSLQEAVLAFSRKAVFDTSLKIWNLARSTPDPTDPSVDPSSHMNEPDFVRLCRCGAGFFRAFAFHASYFLAVELRAELQEEDSVPRPDLLSIPQDSADMVLRTIEAGETGIKGYLLHCIISAQIDGIRRRVGKDEMTALLGSAAEDAIGRCLPLLERISGQEPAAEGAIEAFDFDVSPAFFRDWDLVMSDIFDIDGGEIVNFDASWQ
jgi:hypothetical protein